MEAQNLIFDVCYPVNYKPEPEIAGFYRLDFRRDILKSEIDPENFKSISHIFAITEKSVKCRKILVGRIQKGL